MSQKVSLEIDRAPELPVEETGSDDDDDDDDDEGDGNEDVGVDGGEGYVDRVLRSKAKNASRSSFVGCIPTNQYKNESVSHQWIHSRLDETSEPFLGKRILTNTLQNIL